MNCDINYGKRACFMGKMNSIVPTFPTCDKLKITRRTTGVKGFYFVTRWVCFNVMEHLVPCNI